LFENSGEFESLSKPKQKKLQATITEYPVVSAVKFLYFPHFNIAVKKKGKN